MKIGYALSGGGSRGFAHLGAIQALSEMGIRPHQISGTSAGALLGALIAEGYSPKEIFDSITNLGIRSYLKFAFNKFGLFTMEKVEVLLSEMIPHNSFEGLKTPLVVCATDLIESEAVFFEKGPLSKPIAASCSIPGIFEPIVWEGKTLVDGGVVNNLPIEPLMKTCTHIIGINSTPVGSQMPINNMKDVLTKCLHMAISRQASEKLQKCSIAIEPLEIVKYDGLDITKAKEIFDWGYLYGKKTQRQVDELLSKG